MEPRRRIVRLAAGLTLAASLSVLLVSAPRARMYAQNPPSMGQPVVSQAVAFAVTGPILENAGSANGDSGESAGAAEPLTASPSLSFDGLSNQDNFNAFGSRLSVPDTNGDVGPNHYVQSINTLWRVWDKDGNPLSPPLRLSTNLFAPLGEPCSLQSKGDPIVLYDPLADRWLISQLGFATTPGVPPYFECIAVSQTADPLGAYFLYAFQTAGNELPDYPKLGVWSDGYYMTVNQFTNGGPFNGTGAYAFDREKMLAGDPTASYVYFNLNLAEHPEGIGGMLPSDFDGLIPPPAGRPNTFAYVTSTAGLRLFDFHADFVNPADSTFTERSESPVAVAPFNPTTPSGRADIPQPLPGVGLDSISDRLMHRLQYRNFGLTESLVVNHTVGAPASTVFGAYRAGVRYYQLTRGAGPFAVTEQTTYAPEDGLSRWMGSAATDNQGNLAIGFSTSSATSRPSVAYAGRLATDPPGGLFQGENTLVTGTGVQTGSNRWGDYSALAVDPSDDCTFWYTSEYYTAASQASSPVGWLTRIGRFKFPSCTPPLQGTLQGLISSASSGLPVSGALIHLSNGFSQVSFSNGSYSRKLAPGVYDVTVSRTGFVTAVIGGVAVSDGNTTTLNVALSGTPVVIPGDTALTAESFLPANGAIDPGETVTVDLSLTNVGGGVATNLMATLLTSGGVLDPGAPVSFGSLAAAGGAATRSFTFRADALLGCGAKLTATMRLQDGAADLGEVSFEFVLAGNVLPVYSEAFDGVTAPALPAGWSATNGDASPTLWVTFSTGSVHTPPNSAFVTAPAVVSDKRLDSAAFFVRSAAAQMSFHHTHAFQSTFGGGLDGGVLEISIDGGPFADILLAGGSFALNGYNLTIAGGAGNPLAGRMAWSGTLPERTTVVNLPPAAEGRMVKLRWRMGSNSSVGSPVGQGWFIDTIAVTEIVSPCNYVIGSAGSAVTAESFLPANGAIDAGETVTVNLSLRNTGTGGIADLTATLLATGGVLDPGGPQSYGAIAPAGGTGTQPFSFRADPLLGCGGTLIATLHLEDGSIDLGTVSFNILLAGSRVTILSENFDGVTAPALPAGWLSSKVDASPTVWVTDLVVPDTPLNDAFINGPDPFGDKRLDSPALLIRSVEAQLTFRHFNITQSGFDGGVLEISIDGGPFADILAAGGAFVAGGYTSAISLATGSPIAGRMAWTGNSGGYRTTTVNLPAAAANKTVKLRWRYANDSSITSAGWRVDTVSVTDVVAACNYNFLAAGAAITTESFAPANDVIDPGEKVSVNFTLKNAGTQDASSLTASLLAMDGVTDPSAPQSYGAIAGNGGTGTQPFTFRADPSLPCRDPLVVSHRLVENGVDLGTVKFNLVLGGLSTPTRLAENFDGVVAPLLPPGWVASSPDASPVLWVTATGIPHTAPNAAFVSDPAGISDRRLDSPPFAITSPAAQLTFRHIFTLDSNFDGGVLEISLDGGPFTDILVAGGSFVQGGYNGSISIGELNPLDGRRVWTGGSDLVPPAHPAGTHLTTIVNLPSAAAGKTAQLRWRMGSGLSVGGPGWRVDTITVVDNIPLCAAKAATETALASSHNPSTHHDPVTFTATVTVIPPGSGVPEGTVTFKNGDTVLAANVPLSGGVAAFTTSALAPGSHALTARYNGAPDHGPSEQGITQVVGELGRMTGGGGLSTAEGVRVTHFMELRCDPSPLPNTLDIRWGQGSQFQLETITSVLCVDDEAIATTSTAGFNTIVAAGIGKLNGQPAVIEWTFTDAGEPGRRDTATIVIRQEEVVVLNVSGHLERGNHQAHKDPIK